MHIMLGIRNNLLDDCVMIPDTLIGLENMPEAVHQG